MSAGENIDMEAEGPPATGNKRTKTQGPSASGLPPKPKKKFPKRADVWEHFIELEDPAGKSSCRYCGLEISSDSKSAGTSGMRGHIGRCKQFKAFTESDKQKGLGMDNNGDMQAIRYDPLGFRRAVNEMVVINELPFSFVESEGWKRFCFNVLPMYKTFSRRTCTREIAAMFVKEKASLKNLLGVGKKRVSLTTDIWVSPTTSYNYMVITCHWIDENWKLQKRILSFKPITDHKGETIAGQLIDCIEEWGIEKVFTVTVDNAKANDVAVMLFAEAMRWKGVAALVQDGDFLHMRCCAHVLNLVVKDGLARVKPSIVAIRNAVKYVRSSFQRLKSFELRCETGKVSRGSLPLDCLTRWNSTYLMLKSALKLRVAFEKMLGEDKLYCDYFLEDDEKEKKKRVGPPTSSDWDEVQRLKKFLKIFFNCTLAFSASKSVTSTICYHEIVTIERNLISKCGSGDMEIRKQAHIMRDKFEKYWDGLMNMNPLVIIGSVFDPRNKMEFASLCFEKLYGKGTIECRKLHTSVTQVLKNLYNEYYIMFGQPDQTDAVEDTSDHGDPELSSAMFDLSDDDDGYETMDSLYSQMASERRSDNGSELEIYLTEKTEPKGDNGLGLSYDVLSWWKRNSVKFYVLSELAKDVLAVQVSSVASESAFSTSGRILDPYRSSLTPYMIEALICTQQWMRSSNQSQPPVASLAQMLEEVDFFESLGKF